MLVGIGRWIGGCKGSNKATKPQVLSLSVCPGRVEACPERLQGSLRGPFFLLAVNKEERCFDKLSTNGIEISLWLRGFVRAKFSLSPRHAQQLRLCLQPPRRTRIGGDAVLQRLRRLRGFAARNPAARLGRASCRERGCKFV